MRRHAGGARHRARERIARRASPARRPADRRSGVGDRAHRRGPRLRLAERAVAQALAHRRRQPHRKLVGRQLVQPARQPIDGVVLVGHRRVAAEAARRQLVRLIGLLRRLVGHRHDLACSSSLRPPPSLSADFCVASSSRRCSRSQRMPRPPDSSSPVSARIRSRSQLRCCAELDEHRRRHRRPTFVVDDAAAVEPAVSSRSRLKGGTVHG